jgi:lysozyme
MKTNEAGRKLIKDAEGLRLKAYNDPGTGGLPITIGYGTTRINGKAFPLGTTCTKEQAEDYLEEDLVYFENLVSKFVKVPLNENQFSAIVSAVYNIGPGVTNGKDGIFVLHSGSPSTFLTRLNGGNYGAAAEALLSWTRGGGKILSGLVTRRQNEKNLFNTPV